MACKRSRIHLYSAASFYRFPRQEAPSKVPPGGSEFMMLQGMLGWSDLTLRLQNYAKCMLGIQIWVLQIDRQPPSEKLKLRFQRVLYDCQLGEKKTFVFSDCGPRKMTQYEPIETYKG